MVAHVLVSGLFALLSTRAIHSNFVRCFFFFISAENTNIHTKESQFLFYLLLFQKKKKEENNRNEEQTGGQVH